jgi:hypothetical protein
MTNDINLRATNEAALALYNFERGTALDSFETVPLNTVLLYRDKAASAIRAYAIATVVGIDGGE